MHKLLNANFSRLRKNKVFWLCIAAVFLIAAFNVLNFYRQITSVDEVAFAGLEEHYFELLPLFGILSSIVIGLFLGTEYSDGTMRNKLIIGHTRTNIYLSSAVTCAAVSAAVTFSMFVGGAIGIPLLGFQTMPLSAILLYMLAGVLSSVALSAVFTLISMNCSRKAEGAVIAILSALAMMIIGSVIYNMLQEPEMISEMVMTSNGIDHTEPHLNPDYVGGTLRSVLIVLLQILPSGQQILMANLELLQPTRCMFYSVGLTVVLTICGKIIYRKKDLK